jgi:galactitol-specific phosphotransferase system IIC component
MAAPIIIPIIIGSPKITVAFGLVGIPIGIAISKIPGLNKLHADPESIQKRFGIFGEPMMMLVNLRPPTHRISLLKVLFYRQ